MDADYVCEACNKIFTLKRSLTKHYERCEITKYIKTNLNKANFNKDTNNDNRQNEINILQFKLEEANEIIKEIEQKNNDLQKSNEILQIRLEVAQTKIEERNKIIEEKNEEKNNIIEDKNKIIDDKNDEIKDFRRYYDYFMTGNSNTMKDLCSIIKLDKESSINMNNMPSHATGSANNSMAGNAHSNAIGNASNSATGNANNHSHNAATNSHNATNNITMVLNNYAPSAIQPIDDLIDIKETLNQYINLFELWSKEKIFHRKLGDIIISNYQETDPSEQKVWCTDVNRFVYYIRTVENSECIAGRRNNMKEIWENDKGGIKVSKYIIEPVLTCLDTLLRAWLFNNDRTKDAGMHVLTKMGLVANILELITTGDLNKMILQYISNYFSITKTGQSAPIKPTSNLNCIKKLVLPLSSESNSEIESKSEIEPESESESEPESESESGSESESEPESDSESDSSNEPNASEKSKKIINKRIIRKESISESSSSESDSDNESSANSTKNKTKLIKKNK